MESEELTSHPLSMHHRFITENVYLATQPGTLGVGRCNPETEGCKKPSTCTLICERRHYNQFLVKKDAARQISGRKRSMVHWWQNTKTRVCQLRASQWRWDVEDSQLSPCGTVIDTHPHPEIVPSKWLKYDEGWPRVKAFDVLQQ